MTIRLEPTGRAPRGNEPLPLAPIPLPPASQIEPLKPPPETERTMEAPGASVDLA